MKTSRRIKNAFGLGHALGLALLLGSPTSAQTRSESKQSTATPTSKPADSRPAMMCAKCKTEAHEEFSVTKVGDEWVSRTTGVGTKHTCDACGGRITAIRGATFNAMMDYCPICAKARPNCCTPEASHTVAAK